MKNKVRILLLATCGILASCASSDSASNKPRREEGYWENGRRYINTDYGRVMVEGSYINYASMHQVMAQQSAALARSGSAMTAADVAAQQPKR